MKYVASLRFARRRNTVVVLLTGAFLAVCLLVLVRKADAALDGTLMRLGSDALSFPGTVPGPPGTIRINGTDVSYRVETLSKSLPEVWEHYSRTCGGGTRSSGAMGTLVRTMATRGASSETQAYVACLDLRRDDLPTMAQLVKQLARTWDLSSLGALRYVYAQRDSSDPSRTLVFSMWADESFDLRNFVFRGAEDAPGDDPRFFPRPLASYRVLSVEHSPHRLATYRVPHLSPEAQARWYTHHFRSNGWRLAAPSEHGFVDVDGVLLVAAEQESRSATVAISLTDSGSTLVTTVEGEAR